jgi:hypothetical protein
MEVHLAEIEMNEVQALTGEFFYITKAAEKSVTNKLI